MNQELKFKIIDELPLDSRNLLVMFIEDWLLTNCYDDFNDSLQPDAILTVKFNNPEDALLIKLKRCAIKLVKIHSALSLI